MMYAAAVAILYTSVLMTSRRITQRNLHASLRGNGGACAHRRRHAVRAGLWLAMVLPIFALHAENGPPLPIGDQVQQFVQTLLTASPESRERDVLVWESLQEFYGELGNRPVWVDRDGVLTPAGLYVFNILEHAEGDALDPSQLHIDELRQLRAQLHATPQQLARIDLLLSDGALRYVHEFHPTTVAAETGSDGGPQDLLAAYRSNQVEAFMSDLPPKHRAYRKLREALATYKNIAAAGGWPVIPGSGTPAKGKSDPAVPALRRYLRIAGDYVSEERPLTKQQRHIMEPGLARALQAFQRRHALSATGRLDAVTRTALNVPISKRIDQMKANMVRWRSLPSDLGNRYVMVNVTAYSVELMDNGERHMSLRAIVGRPDRPTPALASEISSIVFNPTWHVPTKLASEDLAPKQYKDPSFFTKQRIHVYRGRGSKAVEIHPASINWAQVDNSKFPYNLRQDPGPENSLGHIKFTFDNAYDVYLHDTPKRSLFARPARALSSGCVRVEQPVKLAAYLLHDETNGAWTEERIKEVIGQGKRKTVHLKERMPIYLVYWTAWVDDDAKLNFREDIYGLDSGARSCVNGACLAAKLSAPQ